MTPNAYVIGRYQGSCGSCHGLRVGPAFDGCEWPNRHLPDALVAHEHADYSGWSCVVCNGPCGQPNADLPRCGDPAPGIIGALCNLHEGHRRTHAFSIQWGEGWDK